MRLSKRVQFHMPLRNQECGLSVLKSVSNSLKFSILILKEKIPIEPTLPQPRVNPATLDEFETGLEEWHTKCRNKWIGVIQLNQKNFGLFPMLVNLLFQMAISLSYSWEFIRKKDKMSYSRKLPVATD